MKSRLLLTFAGVLMLASCSGTAKNIAKMGKAPQKNEGPCPAALVLWDAARKVDIGEPETYRNVGFTGEIERVRSFCTYVGTDPIKADLEIDFAFGRGPAAKGDEADYPYFVSVTRKDIAVLDKQTYNQRIHFKKGENVVHKTVRIDRIIIPRADKDVSGVNFEIISGFVLNDKELKFARSGKRFRIDAGAQK